MLEFVLDPTWFLILAPVLGLAFWARRRSARARANPSPSGLTAAEVARAILDVEGIGGVTIAEGSGPLADFYDPNRRTLHLADPGGETLADVVIAAREAGYAVRDARADRRVRLRRPLAFAVGLASDVAWMLILAGFLLAFYRLVLLGTIALAAAALGGLAAYGCSRDAGRRGLRALSATGRLDPDRQQTLADLIADLPWSCVASILPGRERAPRPRPAKTP